MKQILIFIFTLFASLGYAQTPKWVNKAKKAIVSIITYDKDNKIISTGNGFFVKPNFKVAGPIFGSNIKVFSDILANLTESEIAKLNNKETIKVTIDDTEYEIDDTYTDIRINAKDGYNVGMEDNLFVILNTVRTKELVLEGLAREFVSKVQNIRKQEYLHLYKTKC